MTKKDLIKMIKDLPDNEELFVMLWEKDNFTTDDILGERKLSEAEWNYVVKQLDEYSFDSFHEDLTLAVQAELTLLRTNRLTNKKKEGQNEQ